MITLNNLLNLTEDELKNTKIRLIKRNGENDPHQVYIDESSTVTDSWFLWRQANQQTLFYEGNIALGLLRIAHDRYLFVTAMKILKVLDNKKSGIGYETEVLKEYEKYFGRVVVKYHDTAQQQSRWAKGFIDKLEVLEILPSVYEGKEFPGYENVTLSWKELNTIIKNQKQDWITALKNQKGVYLITDTKDGKFYVGSAYGQEMLLQRWTCYVENGHGGNVELKKLSFEHIKENFRYSILETYNNTTSDEYIIHREEWWKHVLNTINTKWGYNKN